MFQTTNQTNYGILPALHQLIAPGAAFCLHELGTACTRAGGAGGANGAGAVVQTWIHNCWVNPRGAQPLETHGIPWHSRNSLGWLTRFFKKETQASPVQN